MICAHYTLHTLCFTYFVLALLENIHNLFLYEYPRAVITIAMNKTTRNTRPSAQRTPAVISPAALALGQDGDDTFEQFHVILYQSSNL